MTGDNDRLEQLYEISLAIESKADLRTTAQNALSAFLQELGCTAGAILEWQSGCEDEFASEPIVVLPSASATRDVRCRTRDHLADRESPIEEVLPLSLTLDGETAHVVALSEFGALVLVTDGGPFDDELLAALEPLGEKLAAVCREKRTEARLREERDRFETMFETLPEPIAHVVYEDSEPIVKRVNEAFETTFGDDAEPIVGRPLDALCQPGSEPPVGETAHTERHVGGDGRLNRELRRETVDGAGDFLFRSAVVDSPTDRTELFGLYVDVTAAKTRQRKLEQLSAATQDLLAAQEREVICDRAVDAAETILDLSFAEVSLHDRAVDALLPVAMTESLADGEPTAYDDRGSAVWLAYRTGQSKTIEETAAFERRLDASERPIDSVVVVPLGHHGVFAIGAPATDAFDTSDHYFLGLLSTLIETALDRATRERGLERIQETTRAAVAAETHQDVADATVKHLSTVLDFPLSTIWTYDASEGALVPVASTTGSVALFDEIPTIRRGEGIVWDVFQSGETRIVDDVGADPDAYNAESAVASEIIVPIGEYGVLATGSRLVSNFSQTERNLVEILAANLETAIELVDRRQELEVLDQVLARILRHNIRNDLTVIQGHATRIAAGCEGEPAGAAETILRKSRDLESTAEHAHEMRAVVAQRGEQTQTALDTAAKNAIAAVERAYPAAAIETDFRTTATVTAHPRLETALRQLIENAVEHGSARSSDREDARDGGENGRSRDGAVADCGDDAEPQVTVSIRSTDAGPVLTIADTGPGIDPMEVDVLERHGETALRHGSGAGLWIADRIVDYSDGTLDFETDDRGTTVHISFE